MTKTKGVVIVLIAIAAAVIAIAAAKYGQRLPLPAGVYGTDPEVWTEVRLIENPQMAAEKIVNGAKQEVNKGVRYNASYLQIPYPNGDVPSDRGACTDVIVRALRNAGYDLQKLIHKDMSRNFKLYPQTYGLSKPDSNIDHRRVPNQMTYLRRHGLELPKSVNGSDKETWQPGDLVYWKLDYGADHCGVISNDTGKSGLPMVIHNLGGAKQEDCLTRWEITGHFRLPTNPDVD
ncbi:MAG TPA: DUF1287 domain-containing protein [Armatimonadota bacterium]|nr:DUF1287 domain-containing protein [Armatimonadota bacterium]